MLSIFLPCRTRTPLLVLLLLSSLALATGCATIVGNVKPVEQKSESYGVLDLAQNDPDWGKLNNATHETQENSPTEVSDVAFQSKKTASIISLNSACREVLDPQETDLRRMTDLLFLGISDISFRSEQPISIQGTPALETTVRGRLNNEEVMLRTVVLRRSACIYDLVYMARPQHFEEQVQVFSRFVASLRLK